MFVNTTVQVSNLDKPLKVFLKLVILCLGQEELHHSVTFTFFFFLISSLFQMVSSVRFCVSKEDQALMM